MLLGCPSETDGAGAGAGGPTGPECEVDSDCPKGSCESAACESGSCALAPLEEGLVLDTQIGGDCQDTVCDGEGTSKQVENPDDIPGGGDNCVSFTCVGTQVTGEFNVGATCGANNEGFCLPNPQDDNPFAYACVQCTQNSHCKTMVCDTQEGNCSPATCANGLVDGEETAEDCGGNDCPSCGTGLACLEDGDCLSDDCDNADGTCNAGN